jgi:hypothetical protein
MSYSSPIYKFGARSTDLRRPRRPRVHDRGWGEPRSTRMDLPISLADSPAASPGFSTASTTRALQACVGEGAHGSLLCDEDVFDSKLSDKSV